MQFILQYTDLVFQYICNLTFQSELDSLMDSAVERRVLLCVLTFKKNSILKMGHLKDCVSKKQVI